MENSKDHNNSTELEATDEDSESRNLGQILTMLDDMANNPTTNNDNQTEGTKIDERIKSEESDETKFYEQYLEEVKLNNYLFMPLKMFSL